MNNVLARDGSRLLVAVGNETSGGGGNDFNSLGSDGFSLCQYTTGGVAGRVLGDRRGGSHDDDDELLYARGCWLWREGQGGLLV